MSSEKPEPIDWDIVFALMQCYDMLNLDGFPMPKKHARRVRLSKARKRPDLT